MATLSLIIPVYNRESKLPETLDSILSQKRMPEELIIVDNNSSDGSKEVCQRYVGSFRQKGTEMSIITEMTPGAAAARNTGLYKASGDWIMFFDSDDIMHPEHIYRALKTALSYPNAELIGWDINYCSLKGGADVKQFPNGDYQWNNIMHGSLSTQRYMAVKDLFIKAGGWNNEVRFWDDIELGSRILNENPIILKAEGEATVTVMASEESITGAGYRHALEKAITTLRIMSETLRETPEYVAVKAAILAGDIFLEDKTAGMQLFRMLKNGEVAGRLSAKSKLLSYLAYHYRKSGLRGAARILHPLV